jgi:serine/threonine protein kinase
MRIANHSNSGSAASRAPIAEHELVCPIASGAYGQVWLARSALGTYRAIKLVHRANFDHDRPFEREFAGIQRYEPISRSHEGLVDLLQVGRNDPEGYFYYVMELADDARSVESSVRAQPGSQSQTQGPNSSNSGLIETPAEYVPTTLKQMIQTHGRLSCQECIQVGLSLSSALAYLHGQGLVHRDIKPSNVIFVEGIPKLADVGLVTGAGETRSYVGTEGYIAPEGPGTPQADIYSLGIVLYVMSTGKSHQDFPEPLSNLSSQPEHARWLEFNAVIDKACQAEVRERYQTAQEMHQELALLQRGQSITHERATQRRWSRAKKLLFAALAVALLLQARPLLTRSKHEHTPTPQAQRSYDLGRWYFNQLTPESQKKALEYLNQAVQIDPEFVKPYRELVAIYIWNRQGTSDGAQRSLQKCQEFADLLLARDPKLAAGHAALSLCRLLHRDWRGAEQECIRAIRLDPEYTMPRDFYTYLLTAQGRTEEAKRQIQRSLELDPTARTSAMVASWPFIAERRFDLAIAQLKHVIELERGFPEAHSFLGRCYEAQSNYLAAIEEFQTFDLLTGNDAAKVTASYAALRDAYNSSGQPGYFRKYIELIEANKASPEDQRLFDEMDLAGCYAQLGEKRKALDEIEKYFDLPGVWQQLKFEPLFDNLHEEPRFQALLKRAGLEL